MILIKQINTAKIIKSLHNHADSIIAVSKYVFALAVFIFCITYLLAYKVEPVHAVNVTGNISTNTTWNAAGSPYVMTGNVTVLTGVTLTIDTSAGPVFVRSGGNYGLYINSGGTVNAIGTSTNKITFTHNTATAINSWIGIRVASGGVLNLSQCNFNYAGYAVNANGGTANVSDCTFTSNAVGVSAYNQGTATTARNTFNKNTNPVSMEWDSTLNLGQGANVDILGTAANINTYNAILISGFENNAVCVSDLCTVSKKNFAGITNIPYMTLSTNPVFNNASDVINIEPGVILKMSASRYILVQSTAVWHVNGTLSEPVYFTSIHDDTIGGDTNNNGTATTPAAASWDMIRIDSAGGIHTFDHVIYKYSGNGLVSYGTNVEVVVSDSLFDNNSYGLGAYNQGTSTSIRNTYYRNAIPVSMEWDSVLNLGQGADIDIIGTGTEKNTNNAIGVGGYSNNLSCVSDICTISKLDFAGITNIPYYVRNAIAMDGAADVVNIDPGVIIKIHPNSYILVQSTSIVQANGTALEPIYITSLYDDTIGGDTNNDGTATTPSMNNWSTFRIENNGGTNTFNHIVFRYCNHGLITSGSNTNMIVSDSVFESNSTGLGAYTQGTTTSNRNTFNKNLMPVSMEWDSTLNLGQGADSDTLGTGANLNTVNAIGVAHWNQNNSCRNNICTVVKKYFAGMTNAPYYMAESLNFNDADDVITFQPGVIVKVYTYRVLTLASNTIVNANGTVTEPIYFTSIHNDAIGGDTNNNGTATVSARNNWEGLRVSANSTLSMSYADVSKANVGLMAAGVDTTVDINNSFVYDNNYGVVSRVNATIDTHSNVYLRNEYPIGIDFDAFMTLGEGANVDVLGTGVDQNDNNGIVVNPYNTDMSCLNNICNIPKKNFAGITNIPYLVRYPTDFNNVDDVVNVDPGVIIKGSPYGINISSNVIFNVNGQSNERVYFTSHRDDSIGGDSNNNGSTTTPDRNDWTGITNSSTGTVSISYAEIDYTNQGIVALDVGSTTIVSDSIFISNNYGISSRTNATVTTQRNTFYKNFYPVSMEFDSFFNFGQGADVDILGTGADQNDYNAIAVNPYNTAFACLADVCNIIKKNFAGITNIPYVFRYNSTFSNANDVVNIDPGVIFKATSYAMIISSNVVLNVNGQTGQMVYFTSIHDDSVGGDTNNNGSATTPARGNWGGITKSSTGSATFTFTNINYASNGIYSTAGTLSVTDSNFYTNNIGLYVVMTGSPYLRRINFEGNYNQGLRNGNTTVVKAENLWWEDVGGPNDADPTGQCPSNTTPLGDIVTDSTAFPVTYCPYSTTKFIFNQVPIVTNVQINSGGSSINLLAGTSTPVVCTGTVVDDDGYIDIVSVTAKFYRTAIGSGAADNINNHYTVTGNTACVPSNGSGVSEDYTCTLNIYFTADPTDIGSPNAADNWSCTITANDGKSESAEVSANVEMNSLIGIEIVTPISYGSVNPGSDTASYNFNSIVKNVGNRVLDFSVVGTDMCTDYPTCSANVIAASYQRFSLTAFTYPSGLTLTGIPYSVDANIAKPTANPSNQSANLYWGIGIPAGQNKGVYTGVNTISGSLGD